MDRDERIGRYQREIEAILEAMEQDGVAGGTVGPHGATVGMPNWAEHTKDQRFSQKGALTKGRTDLPTCQAFCVSPHPMK